MRSAASRLTLHAARALLAGVLVLNTAHAQVHSNPVHQNTGPLSDLSTNAGAGSQPVHEPGRSVRDGSLGTFSGNSVRDSVTGDVHSGPVSDISVGPVTSGQPVSGGGTMTDASVGAVKKDKDSPLREPISQTLRDLGPLQEQLRALQPEPDTGPSEGEPGATEAEEPEMLPDEEAIDSEAQEGTEPEPLADEEEPEAGTDGAEAEGASGVPEEPLTPELEAQAEPPSEPEMMTTPPVIDDPRDAAEATPTPARE